MDLAVVDAPWVARTKSQNNALDADLATPAYFSAWSQYKQPRPA